VAGLCGPFVAQCKALLDAAGRWGARNTRPALSADLSAQQLYPLSCGHAEQTLAAHGAINTARLLAARLLHAGGGGRKLLRASHVYVICEQTRCLQGVAVYLPGSEQQLLLLLVHVCSF
jgi:hypothetical protein